MSSKSNEEQTNSVSIEEKALSINLDSNKYGTIVEIGAGQEVARQFFTAGGAAGTVAKTMSAYDMQVSDDIYGKASRYVSRERLEQMLDTEYDLLQSRLGEHRSKVAICRKMNVTVGLASKFNCFLTPSQVKSLCTCA